MPLDFRLLGQPVNALEALQAYGAAQQMREQQMERERKEEERQVEQRRLARLQAGLGASINRETGAVDPGAARGAYLDAGDATGAMKFETARSEQQAAQIKAMTERREVGLRLLQQAKDPQSYAWARARAKEYGFDISTIPEQYDAAFVERAHAELMALDPQKASAPPSAVLTLQAMGIAPQSEEGRAILTDHLNPPAYQVFGDSLIQTRGATGGGTGGGGGGQNFTGGWTPRARNGGDNSDEAVDNKIAGAAQFLGIAADADLSSLSPLQIARAMTLSEGGAGTLADRNNNPANMKNTDGTFRKFPTMEAGLAAAAQLVARKIARGQVTLQSLIEGLPAGQGGPRVVATRPGTAKPSQTRVVNGVAYYKVGGLWYDNPEGK